MRRLKTTPSSEAVLPFPLILLLLIHALLLVVVVVDEGLPRNV